MTKIQNVSVSEYRQIRFLFRTFEIKKFGFVSHFDIRVSNLNNDEANHFNIFVKTI